MLNVLVVTALVTSFGGCVFVPKCVGPGRCGGLDDHLEPFVGDDDPYERCCSCSDVETCTNSRNEEVVFVKWLLPSLKEDMKTFVEIGGNDGIHASNTLFLEHCLGWNGTLIEAHPVSFHQMVRNRPRVTSVNAAGCDRNTTVRFSRSASPISAVVKTNGIHVPCAPLSSIFQSLRLTKIGFFSIDVEGSEVDVLNGIDFNHVDIATLVIEELGKTPKKNLLARNILRSKAHMRLTFRHCWRPPNEVCDSFWYNPAFVDYNSSSSPRLLPKGTRPMTGDKCRLPKPDNHHHY